MRENYNILDTPYSSKLAGCEIYKLLDLEIPKVNDTPISRINRNKYWVKIFDYFKYKKEIQIIFERK